MMVVAGKKKQKTDKKQQVNQCSVTTELKCAESEYKQ